MANPRKSKVLDDLQQRFGDVHKLKGSESLFVIGDEAARIYFRYSKVRPSRSCDPSWTTGCVGISISQRTRRENPAANRVSDENTSPE